MLEGLRVIDASSEISGPYCAKLFADAGAHVTRIEVGNGDPLRRRGSGALFEFLNAGKDLAPEGTEIAAVLDGAALLITDRATAADVDAWRAVHPALVIVTITPFGVTGPWAGRPATEFTVQAWCGSTGFRGFPDGPPLAAGGEVGAWVSGTYAAMAALVAVRGAETSGAGEHVDVAMLDCMAITMVTMPSVFSDFAGWPPLEGTGRTIEVPSIEPALDGYVAFTTNSAQQFADFLVMIGRPDLVGNLDFARVHTRFRRRAEFLEMVHAFTAGRTAAELLEEAATFRIPAGPVLNGATVTEFEQFVARGVFEPSPSGRFRQPRIPYRITVGDEVAPAAAAPVEREPGPRFGPLPLAGVRVVDCTAWWAGPAAGHALACLGADVVKVESITRPDGMRYATVKPPTEDHWWEWGPLYHSANTNKRGITIDLTQRDGRELFERLLDSADVLLENFTPRVMEQFGLDWPHVHARNPRLVMVRMPAFGLDGPWRDRTGFAQTMESMAGMAWRTGFPDGPPVLVRGACDPLAGMHAVFATIVALRDRDADGRGRMVESVMVEAALNAAAEAVVEYETSGTLLSREGNRGPLAAPQGVYECAGDDRWLAIAVNSDGTWEALRCVVGVPELDAPEYVSDAGRRAGHDAIDAVLSGWCRERDAAELAEALCKAGVPAADVISPRDIIDNPQIRHRGLFETVEHPILGVRALPGMPFRYGQVQRWVRSAAPTVGQHNDEILSAVATAEELEALRERGVIGDRPRG